MLLGTFVYYRNKELIQLLKMQFILFVSLHILKLTTSQEGPEISLDEAMNIEVDWKHVVKTANKFSHLPEFITIKLPVDPNVHVTLELHRKEDEYHKVPVILGGEDGHVLWESHEDEKFHVYSDQTHSASFTVAINDTKAENPKITYFGSFINNGRMYSLRPGTKDHVHHDILQHFPVTIHNHLHVVVEDKPMKGHSGKDYFAPDEL